jgi:hypothetical protein
LNGVIITWFYKTISIITLVIYKHIWIYKIAVIDKDFFKSSSSGEKMHLETLMMFYKIVDNIVNKN